MEIWFIQNFLKKHNGKILVRGGKVQTIEGSPSPRTVLIEFQSLEQAKSAYNSPDYQEALQVLKGGADRDIRIFEGK